MARDGKQVEEDSRQVEDDAALTDERLDPPESERRGSQDLLRRLMTVGLSGLFTTESAIRGALGDTVPREWVDFVSDQSDRTRDEFLARLAQEFVGVLENLDIVELAEQLLEGRTIEVKAEFKLGPRDKPATSRATRPKDDPNDETDTRTDTTTRSGPTSSKSNRKDERT